MFEKNKKFNFFILFVRALECPEGNTCIHADEVLFKSLLQKAIERISYFENILHLL